jgi:hypothetical protein
MPRDAAIQNIEMSLGREITGYFLSRAKDTPTRNLISLVCSLDPRSLIITKPYE